MCLAGGSKNRSRKVRLGADIGSATDSTHMLAGRRELADAMFQLSGRRELQWKTESFLQRRE